ncbi:unnamed protein product [Choristocarpus tenellus]
MSATFRLVALLLVTISSSRAFSPSMLRVSGVARHHAPGTRIFSSVTKSDCPVRDSVTWIAPLMGLDIAIPRERLPPTGSSVLPREKKLIKNRQESSSRPEDKYKVVLFNDNGNTREYVSRSLVQVVGMPEEQAFAIMQQAHKNGMATVGIWHQEMADAYSSSLKQRGLVSDITPVD